MERTRSRVYPRSARLIAQVGYTRLAMAPEGLRDPLWRSLAIGAGERLARPPAPGQRGGASRRSTTDKLAQSAHTCPLRRSIERRSRMTRRRLMSASVSQPENNDIQA